MPKANKIWTLAELPGSQGYDSDPAVENTMPNAAETVGAAASLGGGGGGGEDGAPSFLKCCHIPRLPGADQAKALLERVVREFEPVVKQRGYNVLSVSELCCCNDGLDFEPNRRRRKIRKMSNNIWGYNQTSWYGGRKSHTIHLRLRHATNHSRFLLYEDVAGTMAHELAHCEHGPHNEKFYKLMDEILEQHAVLMANKLSRNGFSMPTFGGSGTRLGGGDTSLAAARKQQQSQQHPGYRLGGDNSFKQWMTPAEAAVVAAEARRRQRQLRLRGDRCCRPCTIDLDDDDEDDDKAPAEEESNQKPPAKSLVGSCTNQVDKKSKKRGSTEPDSTTVETTDTENVKPTAKKNAKTKVDSVHNTATDIVCIDLTLDDHHDESGGDMTGKKVRTRDGVASQAVAHSTSKWSCGRCTFLNEHLAVVCTMCQTGRGLGTL